MATHNLTLTRGDSASYVISAAHADGSVRPFAEGDKVYFTVKSSTTTDTIKLQRVIESFDEGRATVYITPEDKDALGYGKWVYDVQLTAADGSVFTIIKPSIFEITSEVTFE